MKKKAGFQIITINIGFPSNVVSQVAATKHSKFITLEE
jgi:hypothetical protein